MKEPMMMKDSYMKMMAKMDGSMRSKAVKKAKGKKKSRANKYTSMLSMPGQGY